jgi:hypothetical protein
LVYKEEWMAMKAKLTKTIQTCVYKDGEQWNVQFGELKRHKGNPGKTAHLFRVIGEKLPFEALSFVRKHIQQHEPGFKTDGVYVALILWAFLVTSGVAPSSIGLKHGKTLRNWS